jgi:transcriptional regulator with XRE-family HTH domain
MPTVDIERGRRLKELRVTARYTQRSLGEAMGGLSSSAVSEWERGMATPEAHRIGQLDDLLNANGEVARLFGAAPRGRDVVMELEARIAELEAVATPQAIGEDSQSSELTTLLASLDRTVKRLEERLERLEHPDASQSPTDPPVANGTDRPLKRPRRSS